MVGLTTVDGTLIDVNKTALELAGSREADVFGDAFLENALVETFL